MSGTSSDSQHDGTAWQSAFYDVALATEQTGWQALGPTFAFTVASTAIVALRWYTRTRILRCIGLDDFIILCSLLLAWVICIIIGLEFQLALAVHHGLELDTVYLAKLIIANNDLWSLAVNITKASILVQYLRFLTTGSIRYACWLLLLLLIPATCWSVFASIFLCTPVHKLWLPETPGRCFDPQMYWLSAAGINICLDFLVLLLPMPTISRLHLPRRQKICLIMLFGLGFFVCVVSVVRLTTVLVQADERNYVASSNFAVILSAIEANVGIICASLLALKPLLNKWFPRLPNDTPTSQHTMRLPIIRPQSLQPRTSEATLVPVSHCHSESSATNKENYAPDATPM